MIKRAVVGAIALSIPLGLAVTAVPASAVESATVVNEQDLAGASPHWGTDNRAGSDDHATAGVGTFVNGPAAPPYGTGSFQMVTPSGNDKIALFTDLYNGTSLQALNDAKYSTYLQSAGTTTPTTTMPTVQLQVTGATGTDGTSVVPFTTFVFEPIYCYGNNAPQFDLWQTWDANHPVETGANGGCWWSTNPVKGLPDRDHWSSLADIKANNPNATIGLIGINLGRNGQTTANVDGLALDFGEPPVTSGVRNAALDTPVVPEDAVFDFEHYTPPAPVASVNDVSMNEGNSGTHNMTFTVTLTGDLSSARTVAYQTQNGTAVTGGGIGNPDYNARSGVLNFAAGQSTATVAVPIHGDKVTEPNQTFTLNLVQAGSTATIGDGSGVGTIVNDDAQPTVKISDASTAEGNKGTKQMIFHVSLNHASALPVTVHYTTVEGTAKAGSDFVSKTGTVTFAPGQLHKNISVQIKGDKVKEKNESFIVTLYDASNATISDPNGSGVIRNDD
jgi:hypothetical protein